MSATAAVSRWSALRARVPLRVVGLGAALLAGLGLVGMGAAVEMSSKPPFCGSCHIMEPYYQSWLTSSHKNIACVECHIAPGMTAEIRKKFEALSMVAKYFTGTYGTNPWAEVEDSACLQCHERRLLAGKELFGDVVFDHTAHLSSSRRGTTLRCTSCHGQIVQGSHIAVTASSCILCHFKDQMPGVGMARCTLCHAVPDKVIQKGNLTFNHSDVGRFGMACTGCHAQPAGNNGAVPEERCLTCHNDPTRLAEYENSELLHRAHVTEHKVECLNCHLTIEHVAEPSIEPPVQACDTCHSQGHSPQMKLYTGTGGHGVDPMPSPMFAAGVSCSGCHMPLPGQKDDVHRASAVSCMSCHGPTYRKLLPAWTAALAARTGGLERQLADSESALAGKGEPPEELVQARFNLDLVTRGRGEHNVDYAFALLDQAHRDLNAARRAGGLPALTQPWPQISADEGCLPCHQGIETQAGRAFGRPFAHDDHLVRAKLNCDTCHRPHAERAKGEVLRFGLEGCNSCHHKDAKADCLACHADIKTRNVPSYRGEFEHKYHVDEEEIGCDECHEAPAGSPASQKLCKNCHKK